MSPIVRKLAREVVIFVLIGGFLGILIGAVIEYRNRPLPYLPPAPYVIESPDFNMKDATPLWNADNPNDKIQSILFPVATPNYVKNCAYHYFYDSQDSNGLKLRLADLPIPESAKSELIRIKSDPLAVVKTEPLPATSNTRRVVITPDPTPPPPSPVNWADIALVLVFSAGIGALAGLVLWGFYRMVRFAIVG
jgi:hypothetical protein